MALTLEEVKHIANLARIELTREDLETYRTQLSAILEHFEQLQEIDPGDYSPPAKETTIHAGLRADLPRDGLSWKALTENAAEIEEDQFRVPPIFD